jgi:hypothetical protein
MSVQFIHTTTAAIGVNGKIGDRRMTIAFSELFGNKLNIGVAVCSPKDHFCKRTGRIKSKGRMLSVTSMLPIGIAVPKFHNADISTPVKTFVVNRISAERKRKSNATTQL